MLNDHIPDTRYSLQTIQSQAAITASRVSTLEGYVLPAYAKTTPSSTGA